MLYLPEHFKAPDRDAIAALVSGFPFATLISVTGAGVQVSHLPLIDDGAGGLFGHLARANPHAALLHEGAETLAIFHGPHAYVSPTWYAEPDVPTWNYANVHLACRVRVLDDDSAQWQLDRLIDAFDSDPLGERGTRHLRADERAPMLAHIHCFTLRVEQVEAKFKLSQNQSPADRQRVISALSQLEDPNTTGNEAVAALMLDTLASPR